MGALERMSGPSGVTGLHHVDLAACNRLVLATLDCDILSLLAEGDRRHVLVIPWPRPPGPARVAPPAWPPRIRPPPHPLE